MSSFPPMSFSTTTLMLLYCIVFYSYLASLANGTGENTSNSDISIPATCATRYGGVKGKSWQMDIFSSRHVFPFMSTTQ